MDKLDDVWISRDIAATLSMTEQASGLALAALERRGRLVSDLVETMGVGYPLGVCEVSGAASLPTGLHSVPRAAALTSPLTCTGPLSWIPPCPDC